MIKLSLSVALVVLGIAVGYIIQSAANKFSFYYPLDLLRKRLQQVALLFLNPIAILGAVWQFNLQGLEILAFPFLGAAALLTGGFLAFAASRRLLLEPRQTGAYIVCGGFTNIGSLGALFCFIFLGESGFALVPFYKLFEEVLYYSVGFPIAKSYGKGPKEHTGVFRRIGSTLTDPFVLTALSGIGIGGVLNFTGIPRPLAYANVNSIFIPLAAFMLLVSIGMNLRFSSVVKFFVPGLVMAGIKVMAVPFIIVGSGYMLGLGELSNGLPLKVVWILSSMPVGFIAMVPPTLYHLDTDLANACWLISNGMIFLQIPLLILL